MAETVHFQVKSALTSNIFMIIAFQRLRNFGLWNIATCSLLLLKNFWKYNCVYSKLYISSIRYKAQLSWLMYLIMLQNHCDSYLLESLMFYEASDSFSSRDWTLERILWMQNIFINQIMKTVLSHHYMFCLKEILVLTTLKTILYLFFNYFVSVLLLLIQSISQPFLSREE